MPAKAHKLNKPKAYKGLYSVRAAAIIDTHHAPIADDNVKRPLVTVSFSGKVSSAASEIAVGPIGLTVSPLTAMLTPTSQALPVGAVANIKGNVRAQHIQQNL